MTPVQDAQNYRFIRGVECETRRLLATLPQRDLEAVLVSSRLWTAPGQARFIPD